MLIRDNGVLFFFFFFLTHTAKNVNFGLFYKYEFANHLKINLLVNNKKKKIGGRHFTGFVFSDYFDGPTSSGFHCFRDFQYFFLVCN